MSAAARVLGIPELLDGILEHAPTKDLLLQQRVNKTWQVTIQRSIPMQKKLFLKPNPTPPNKEKHKSFVGSCIEWNPLLAKIITPPYDNTGNIHCCCFNSAQLDLDSQHTASWQGMLVSNPPASTIYLGVYGSLYWFGMISSPYGEAGVRMEQIVKALNGNDPVGALRSAEHEACCQIEIRQRDVADFS